MALIAETAALITLQRLLTEAMTPHGIRIRCGRFTVDGITAAVKAPGHAKADFILVAGDEPRLFISHKAAGFCHNGYGSGGKKAFLHRSPYRSETVWQFARWAADYCLRTQAATVGDDGLFRWIGPERGIWCLPPRGVGNLIVYGPRMGEGAFGQLNCHIAAVGTPHLTKSGEAFELGFDGGTASNGEVPEGDDAPVIAIGGCIARQRDVYLTQPGRDGVRGFHGWLGFFPYRLLRKADEHRALGKTGTGKGDGLVRVDWPSEIADHRAPESSA